MPSNQSNKLIIEHWYSSKNRREIHYYVGDHDEYLFGYNPKHFKRSTIQKLLKQIELEWKKQKKNEQKKQSKD